MTKYQVLKRKECEMKINSQIVSGEMVEFVQIPAEGPSQVQVYFVPEGKTDAEILGASALNHENELKARGIGFTGPQSTLNTAESEPEPIMEVKVSSTGKVTAVEISEDTATGE